jgi:hypothetical protein
MPLLPFDLAANAGFAIDLHFARDARLADFK